LSRPRPDVPARHKGGLALRSGGVPDLRSLLALDVPAHLATLDADGYPRITPLWFVWEDGAFYMTSVDGRPHVRDLERDSRASLCVDSHERVSAAGARRNRQVKARGRADLRADQEGYWTTRITAKYVSGADGEALAQRRASMPRVLIVLRAALV
jgi:PPOX class probable F420-dependent enzyme